MIITRAGIIKYWRSAPKRQYQNGSLKYLIIGDIYFPGIETLSSKEKDALRPVLAAHPEYLLEIDADRTIQ